MISVPVLIVGGGPVGLTLATDLGWRGIPCLLVERRDGSITLPKMNMVSARTMEFCRRWGIAQEVRRLSIPEDFPRNILFVTSANGYELARFEYPSRADARPVHSPEYLQRCSQIYFDPLLQRTVNGFNGVRLRYHTELVGFDQDDGGVTAQLRSLETGESITVRADYLVGCDGAESFVRESLGARLEGNHSLGEEINIFYLSDELSAMCPRTKAIMQMVYGSEGYLGSIVSVDGIRQWRVSVRAKAVGSSLALARAESIVRRLVGRDFAFEVKSVMPWTRRRLMADSYGRGRVLLAGDAVHQLSPTGGFGMNTGIGDAIDLSWKLAAVIGGWGGARLLDSYETERRPIGDSVTEEGARNYRVLAQLPIGAEIDEASERGAALREKVSGFIRENEYDREFDTDGVTFGYRYEGSPLIVPDGTPEPPHEVMTYRPTARPGHRAPHVWLEDGRSTLDLFGQDFTLLCLGAGTEEAAPLRQAAAACGMPLQIVSLENESVRTAYQSRFALVRPDGHVAWRADSMAENAGALLDRVRGS